MKLLGKNIERNGEGTVKLLPQEEEDMWHVYNLIAVGDLLSTTSFRKVNKESSTGSSTASKVKVELTINVETIQYDSQTSGMRLKGKNVAESAHVKLGAYHTLELSVQKAFTLHKLQWDSIFLDLVSTACDPAVSAELAAIVMEPGLAHLCLVTSHTTLVRSKIEMNIPKKRAGSSDRHGKAITRFFHACLEGILRHVDFKVVKCLIIAGPAFVKNDFHEFVLAEAVKRDLRVLLEHKDRLLVVQASSGQKGALKEVLEDPAVASRVDNTKAGNQTSLLDQFWKMLHHEPDRAFYGPQHVKFACAQRAIDTLLVTDSLFRSADATTRKDYIQLVEDTKEHGGSVVVFSSSHVSGEQLAQLSGVAALLRFPLADMDSFDGEVDSEDEGGS